MRKVQPDFSVFFFKLIYCPENIYSVYKDKLKKNVPVTNLNKYLHCGTSGTESYVYEYRCKYWQ